MMKMKKNILVLSIIYFFFALPSLVAAQVVIEGDPGGLLGDLEIDFFFPANFAVGGIYSLLGYFASLIFSILLVVWIVVIIKGVLQINSSQGDEGGIKSGFQNIKNVFIGLTSGLVFFVVLSLVGVFFGFGNVYQWADKLSMCKLGPAPISTRDQEFKFQAEHRLEDSGLVFADLVCTKTQGWVTIESFTPAI